MYEKSGVAPRPDLDALFAPAPALRDATALREDRPDDDDRRPIYECSIRTQASVRNV